MSRIMHDSGSLAPNTQVGNFYTNPTVRSAERDEVVEALGDRHAFVAAIGDDVVVFDEDCEGQYPRVLAALGAHQ